MTRSTPKGLAGAVKAATEAEALSPKARASDDGKWVRSRACAIFLENGDAFVMDDKLMEGRGERSRS